MRRFLISFGITLLFLVLASDSALHPVRNHARAGEGWLWISTGHCKAWTLSAVEGEIAYWNGACDSLGFVTGDGRLDLRDADGSPIESYAGSFVLGFISGFGYWESGAGSYRGYFMTGKKEGKGEELLRGDLYIGHFRDDRKFGRGLMTWKNGDRYEGRWLHDLADGYGDAVISGVAVSGQWRKGCLLADPTLGAGRPAEECAKILPGLTVYSSDELGLMRWQQEQGLSPWGCQPPKGQFGPGLLLCD
jgi:hypothetical protein